jgi:hypothetical protein
MFRLHKKIKYIKQRLKEWNREVFWNIDQEKKMTEDRMGEMQEQCIQEGYTEERKKEETQLLQDWETRCKQEETMW